MTVGQSPSPVTGAQTLLRALDILDCFADGTGSLTLVELSRRVGLTAPTTHRLVKALSSRGFVVVDGNRRYSLGPAVMKLASVVMERADDLVALTAPTLERLRELTGETVSLHCVLGSQRICVSELVSAEPIRMESGVGGTYPLYAGAAGKAMLAWLPDPLGRVGRLAKVGPATITDTAELELELARIRRRGWAVSESELVRGATSLAVPVFAQNGGGIAGAINIAGPSTRWNKAKLTRLRPEILAEVERLKN